MWLHMCVSEEGHIRVATLKNHLLQNNDFTKLFRDEDHLPPWQRLNFFGRACRFSFMIIILLCITSLIITMNEAYIEDEESIRVTCMKNCQEMHFPFLSCDEQTGQTLQFGGNTYRDLFLFPRVALSGVSVTSGFEDCEALAKSPEFYSHAINEDRQLKLHTCFPSCRRSDDVFFPYENDSRTSCADDNDFDLLCVLSSEPSDHEQGPFEVCAKGNLTGACFSWVWIVVILAIANPIQVIAEFMIYHSLDTLPEDLYYVNVSSNSSPAPSNSSNGNSGGKGTSNATPAAPPTNPDGEVMDCKASCMQTTIEFILIAMFTMAVILLVGAMTLGVRVGRGNTIVLSFFLALIVDQLKSVPIQMGLWWCVVLRFGSLEPGIQQYNEEFLSQFDSEDSLMTLLRKIVQIFLELKSVAYTIIGIVILYSIFMLMELVFGEMWEDNESAVTGLFYFDITLMSFFLFEIFVKFFAYGPSFFFDFWNILDTIVVVVSFAFGIATEGSGNNFGMLRILRLIRVVMVIRKVTEGRKRLKNIMLKSNTSTGIEVSSQLEKVLNILNGFQSNRDIPSYLKDELLWAENIIVNRKLYDVTLEDETGNAATDEDLMAWVPQNQGIQQQQIALAQLNQTVTMTMGGGTMRNFSKSQIGASQIGSMADSSRNKSFSSTIAGSGHGNSTGVAASFIPGSGGSKPQGLAGSSSSSRSRKASRGSSKSSSAANELIQKMFTQAKIRGEADHESDVDAVLSNLDSWNFDVYSNPIFGVVVVNEGDENELKETNSGGGASGMNMDVAVASSGSSGPKMLRCTFTYIIAKYNVVRKFNLDFEKLFNFLTKMEEGHHTPPNQKKVAFHNVEHAIMMMQACHIFLSKCGLNRCIGSLESFILLLSTIFANFGHPGVWNSFLIATRHPLALRFNDKAVVENFSLSAGLKIMNSPEENFWGDLSVAMPTIRLVLLNLILSLETSQLTGNIQLFKTRLQAGDFPAVDNSVDRLTMMTMALRASDVAFCARPSASFTKAYTFFVDEMFHQGDCEKRLGLIVSPFCDRELCNSAKCLLGYIDVAASPVLMTFLSALPETSNSKFLQKEILEDGLEANKRTLMSKIEDK